MQDLIEHAFGLAFTLCGAPVAIVSLRGETQVRLSPETAASEELLGHAQRIGAHLTQEVDALAIEDLACSNLPEGLRSPSAIVALASLPLHDTDRRVIGVIAVADTAARTWTAAQRAQLGRLAGLLEAALQHHLAAERPAGPGRYDAGVWRSRDFLRTLIENLPVAVFAKSARPEDFGVFVAWNRTSEELFGLKTPDVLGKTDYDFFPPDQADFFRAKDVETFARGAITDIPEEPIDSQNHGRLTLHTIKVPVFDAAGRPLYLLGIAENITVRKTVERRLNATMQRLRLATEVAAIGVWELDVSTDALAWDATMYEIYGLERETPWLLDVWTNAIVPEDRERAQHSIQRAIADRVQQSLEFRIQHADGSTRHIQAAHGVLFDDHGTVSRVVGVNVDITAQKNLEIELARARDNALQLARMKSEFLANMSHEIRTPLNAVIGFTTLLLDAEPSAEHQEYLNLINEAGNTLLSIVNDILDLSKLESGKAALESIDFDLQALVRSTADLLLSRAKVKGLTVTVSWNPDATAPVRGDPVKLKQVLLNLISNAIKFTATGGITITVATRPGTGTPRTRIEVTDTGIGVDPKLAHILFQPFTQADASTTRQFGGTGLGLAICKRLVDLMGGDIGLSSTPGRGTTVWLEVALEPQPQVARFAPGPPPAPEEPRAKRGRVLLVEDNLMNRTLACRMLEKLGCEVQAAGDGIEALDVLALAAFDLVLMDCQMPRMDGFTATLRLRDTPGQSAKTPVIALTANALEGDRERCLSAGMNDYLAKPVTLKALSETLDRWLPRAASP